jgi:hypothetical protein
MREKNGQYVSIEDPLEEGSELRATHLNEVTFDHVHHLNVSSKTSGPPKQANEPRLYQLQACGAIRLLLWISQQDPSVKFGVK